MIALLPHTKQIIGQCIRDARNQEICGCLLADISGRQKFCLLSNRLRSRDGFFVSAADWKRIEYIASKSRMKIVALVHSHPAGLEPSRTDFFWLNRGGLPWIIVAFESGELKEKVHGPVIDT